MAGQGGEYKDGLEPIEDGAPGNWNETERGSMALSMFRTARYVPTIFSPPSDFFGPVETRRKMRHLVSREDV